MLVYYDSGSTRDGRVGNVAIGQHTTWHLVALIGSKASSVAGILSQRTLASAMNAAAIPTAILRPNHDRTLSHCSAG